MKKFDEIKAKMYTDMANNQMKNYENMKKEQQRYEQEQQEKREQRVLQIDNSIASTIKVIAWIILGIGGIAGLIIGQQFEDTALIVLLEVWGVSGIATILLLALAEIIQILHDIRLKVYKK